VVLMSRVSLFKTRPLSSTIRPGLDHSSLKIYPGVTLLMTCPNNTAVSAGETPKFANPGAKKVYHMARFASGTSLSIPPISHLQLINRQSNGNAPSDDHPHQSLGRGSQRASCWRRCCMVSSFTTVLRQTHWYTPHQQPKHLHPSLFPL
jgi:hypothetical protein